MSSDTQMRVQLRPDLPFGLSFTATIDHFDVADVVVGLSAEVGGVRFTALVPCREVANFDWAYADGESAVEVTLGRHWAEDRYGR